MKSLLTGLALVLVMLVVSCKEEENVTPSVQGSTWEVYIKWTSAPDTVLFRPRFDAGGTGAEVDAGGSPTGPTFTWTQADKTVSWTYPSTTAITGTLSNDGKTMTGTGTSGSYTAGFRAVKK